MKILSGGTALAASAENTHWLGATMRSLSSDILRRSRIWALTSERADRTVATRPKVRDMSGVTATRGRWETA